MVLGIIPSGGKTANRYMVFVFHVSACCFLFYLTINTMLYAVYPLPLYFLKVTQKGNSYLIPVSGKYLVKHPCFTYNNSIRNNITAWEPGIVKSRFGKWANYAKTKKGET